MTKEREEKCYPIKKESKHNKKEREKEREKRKDTIMLYIRCLMSASMEWNGKKKERKGGKKKVKENRERKNGNDR